MPAVTLSQLESHLWKAAWLLKGPVDAADFKTYITDEHLQRIVRAYQKFKDETGFVRVVLVEEIRAKEGSLSIPLYLGGETQAQTEASTESATTALPNVIAGWLQSSNSLRRSLTSLGLWGYVYGC